MTSFPSEVLKRPFGAASREWMLAQYFGAQTPISAVNAWRHVYRLLLWIDRTTGLAHCYESDKSQPGRHWYGRSLAFHSWLSGELAVPPKQLHEQIDFLFRQGTEILAVAESGIHAKRAAKADEQRLPFVNRDMPEPGSDPELESDVSRILAKHYGTDPSAKLVQHVVRHVKHVLRVENKRKNLVGEGFEDVLGSIADRVLSSSGWRVELRRFLHELPGFREPPKREKPRRVDLALIHCSGRRILASVKWSVRADREEQFGVDWEAYARNEAASEGFEFILITNEFDAARLVSACDRRHTASLLFNEVVHVNPAGLRLVHRADAISSAGRLHKLIDSGRLQSLEAWLSSLRNSA